MTCVQHDLLDRQKRFCCLLLCRTSPVWTSCPSCLYIPCANKETNGGLRVIFFPVFLGSLTEVLSLFPLVHGMLQLGLIVFLFLARAAISEKILDFSISESHSSYEGFFYAHRRSRSEHSTCCLLSARFLWRFSGRLGGSMRSALLSTLSTNRIAAQAARILTAVCLHSRISFHAFTYMRIDMRIGNFGKTPLHSLPYGVK